MKKITIPIIMIVLLVLVYLNLDSIVYSLTYILDNNQKLIIEDANQYKRSYNFSYASMDNDYIPYSYQDLLNIIYSCLNNGWDSFTFYCPEEYTDCMKDIKTISEDATLLTNINNYVNPFNSFSSIKTVYDNNTEITLIINKLYTEDKINEINNQIDKIINENINNDMTLEDKIKTIHNYIINNTTYDVEKNNTGESIFDSNSAYGVLLQKYGICGGYADTMALFLDRLNIPNFKVASLSHVWNAVYLNNTWYHLDLTWDDPVSSDNTPHLIYNYFLISTADLFSQDQENHNFDKTVYQELAN